MNTSNHFRSASDVVSVAELAVAEPRAPRNSAGGVIAGCRFVTGRDAHPPIIVTAASATPIPTIVAINRMIVLTRVRELIAGA